MRPRLLTIAVVLGLAAAACGQRVPGETGVAGAPGQEQPPPDAAAGQEQPPVGAPGEDEGAPPPEAPGPEVKVAPAYRGLGAWIDVFDGRLWRSPEVTVADLDDRGVRTLFLQTNTYRFRKPIRFPEETGRFLEAAHARGMAVVGWYVPDFKRVRRDLANALGAVGFRSPAGHAFDSVAMDIEATVVSDPSVRADRALQLSRDLRAAVGPDYQLGGIVPSPIRGPYFWQILPNAEFARIYDVMLPMAYWSHSISGFGGARDYIASSLEILRGEIGPGSPIHVIGGVADGTTPGEIRGFVDAAKGPDVIGTSIYDVATMDDAEWRALRSLA